MTAPAPSPGPVKRSKRLYVYWGVALTLLLTAGLFSWLVVVPYLEVRAMIRALPPNWSEEPAVAGIARTGGPQAAARKLDLYIHLPKRLVPPADKAAAIALLGCCRPGGFEPLIAALKHEDVQLRRGAAAALGSLGDPRALEPLATALRSEMSSVRSMAAYGLGRLGDRRAVEPLVAALKDEDRYVRFFAAASLGRLGDPRAVEPLVAALEVDDAPSVLGAARKALEEIRAAEQKGKSE